jgi:hypothetical protein
MDASSFHKPRKRDMREMRCPGLLVDHGLPSFYEQRMRVKKGEDVNTDMSPGSHNPKPGT